MPLTIGLIILASAGLSAALIVALRPVLVRYALARPNARSSHKTPTPQGGGIAVVAASLTLALAAFLLTGSPAPRAELAWLAAAVLALAVLGAVDDIRPLPPLLRLVLQTVAVAVVVVASRDVRILPGAAPLWLEQGLLIIGGVWFVNLVNFMDGIDWITAAEIVPLAGFLALLGAAGLMPSWIAVIGAALCGGMLGFAPFNKPVAKLFLGDVGSLPIGLLAGWLLLKLASAGALAAAILLPLYYLADATVTLLRRLAAGERVWEAHRRHYYQQAIDRNGFTVTAVVTHVFLLNLALAALALATIVWPAWPVQAGAVAAGAALVTAMLRRFATPRVQPVTA